MCFRPICFVVQLKSGIMELVWLIIGMVVIHSGIRRSLARPFPWFPRDALKVGVVDIRGLGNPQFNVWNATRHMEKEELEYFLTHFEAFPEEKDDKFDPMEFKRKSLQSRAKRKAVEPYHYWPYGIIPYEMTNTYTAKEQSEIYQGMLAWEQGTCVRFVPFTPFLARQLGHSDRLYVEKRKICTSFLGRRIKGRHLISACPHWTYTMVHELGHAVGMRHQHQTPDRDRYIDIHWENIEHTVNLQQSFGIVGNPSLYDQSLMRAIPYDIDSIMHYPFNAFSKHYSLPTITVKGKPNHKIDWRTKPSFYDLKLVNLMYKCGNHCTFKVNCQNGGYQSPSDCGVCLCPPSHWGKMCERRYNNGKPTSKPWYTQNFFDLWV